MKKVRLLALLATLCIGTSAMASSPYIYSQNFSSGAAGFDKNQWVWPDGYEVGNVGPDVNNAFVVQGGGLDGYPAYCSNGRAANAYTSTQFGPGTTVVYQMLQVNMPLFGSGFIGGYTGEPNIVNLIGFRADQAGDDIFVNFGGALYDTGLNTRTGIIPVKFLIDWEATSVRFAVDMDATGTYEYDHTFTTGIPTTPANFDIFQNAGGRVILLSVNITSTSAVLAAPFCTAPVVGDLNGDCKVNFKDFAIMAANWLACNLYPPSACQ